MPDQTTTKLCECGCGQPAPIAKLTNKRLGHIAGMPTRFISGHNVIRGKTLYSWLCEEIVGKELPDACILWPGAIDKHGYGIVMLPGTRRSCFAHRVAFKLVHGHWPTPCALHTCDVRHCVNVNHLLEGTDAENMADRERKGRTAINAGEKCGQSKLDNASVLKIRELKAAGVLTQREIARMFGVNEGTISLIVKRVNWKHI